MCVFRATHRSSGLIYVGVAPVECSRCPTQTCTHGPEVVLRMHEEYGAGSVRPFHVVLNADGPESFDIDIVERGFYDTDAAFLFRRRQVLQVPAEKSFQSLHPWHPWRLRNPGVKKTLN